MSDVLDLNFSNFPCRVIVHLDVIEGLKAFRQVRPQDTEACGLLLGRVYDQAVEITAFTPPQTSDRRTRTSYTRDSKGHKETAVSIWEQSQGLVGYLGEWHTHPERSPLPSSKDLFESKRIATLNTFLVTGIIIGHDYGCVFLVNQTKFGKPQTFSLIEGH